MVEIFCGSVSDFHESLLERVQNRLFHLGQSTSPVEQLAALSQELNRPFFLVVVNYASLLNVRVTKMFASRGSSSGAPVSFSAERMSMALSR